MTQHSVHFVVPGSLEQRTGGYLYDARMVHGLRARGWDVVVHNLDGRFPDADPTARDALTDTLKSLPDSSRVIIDGLAMGGLPEPVRAHGGRLRVLGLVHHPLADETGLDADGRARFTALERASLEPCVGVLVTSPYTATRIADFGVRAERVRAVPPGTEPATAAIGPPEGEPPLLLCVATVTRRKGHDVLINALDRVRDLDWQCVCAGSLDRDEAWVREVRARTEAAGLADRIDFVGEHDSSSLDQMYSSASIFVLASHYEGYGMALAEALVRGLPVVSTTGGAIPFTVPADAGLLAPPADAAAFADALRSALDRHVRAGLAEAAHRHATELPDWEASVDLFARAILELTPGA